jgi:hypothetical protein
MNRTVICPVVLALRFSTIAGLRLAGLEIYPGEISGPNIPAQSPVCGKGRGYLPGAGHADPDRASPGLKGRKRCVRSISAIGGVAFFRHVVLTIRPLQPPSLVSPDAPFRSGIHPLRSFAPVRACIRP